jgi:hypothetical protein
MYAKKNSLGYHQVSLLLSLFSHESISSGLVLLNAIHYFTVLNLFFYTIRFFLNRNCDERATHSIQGGVSVSILLF